MMTKAEYKFKHELLDNTTEEQKQKYEGKCGIYCIIYKEEIIYVGKSKDILNRICAHITNASVLDAKEYNRPFYCELRRLSTARKAQVIFEVLEYCDEQELNEKEGYYIRKYMPKLNQRVPQEYGPEQRKPFEHVKL